MQAKLLRVLQQREVERVGGMRSIPLDFRLIAATNRSLEEAVRKGAFRQDLFYRLNVVTLHTPALRSRPEDILPLAQHFLARYGAKCGRKITGISPEARTLLRAYEWPGNVRELENAIERAVVLGSSDMMLAEDLPEVLSEAQLPPQVPCGLLHDAVNGAKRAVVQRAFEQANHDHEQAARLLGVHPNYLYRLIKNMALQPLLRR
jgi:transcriptional regulator with PAS, ATPase and Fis domain